MANYRYFTIPFQAISDPTWFQSYLSSWIVPSVIDPPDDASPDPKTMLDNVKALLGNTPGKWREVQIGQGQRNIVYFESSTSLDEAIDPREDDVGAIWNAVAETWSRGLDELKALRSDLQLLNTTINP